ncbi:aminoglycoside phosphotransferase family protein [Desulfobaculum sp.]
MDTLRTIDTFLRQRGWIQPENADIDIQFLAAGEYNANYLVTTDGGATRRVFRINHGSQLGLGDAQIEYEFAVLRALEHSGVTPRPLACDASAAREGLGRGALLMEYLPGRPLDYTRDTDAAARIFAAVHSQPVSDALIVQANPVRDIADESLGLITRYADHPRPDLKGQLLRYHDAIRALADDAEALFAQDPMVIVNTEVNSHNFIVGDEGNAWLVDWEKAVVSSRFQDIGHFLVPTTTLWKTKHRYTAEQKQDFVAAYLRHAGLAMPIDDAMYRADLMERTILLRAMSWCYMAYHEYTRSDRALTNDHTFTTIQNSLDHMECFFARTA